MVMRQMLFICLGYMWFVVDLVFSGIMFYGYFLISVCKDGKFMFCQGDIGDWIGIFLGYKGVVWGVILNKDVIKVVIVVVDFIVKVWDVVLGDELMILVYKYIVKIVDFIQDSNYLLIGGQDKLLCIYDLNKFEVEFKEISGYIFGIKKVLWCSDDKQIFLVDDKIVWFWDYVIMIEVKFLNFNMFVSSMEYIFEGEILVIIYG